MKRQRLLEANEAYQLSRRLEDLDKWLERVELELSSEDHGKDYKSVKALIKKQDNLDAEIASRRDNVKEIVDKAQFFEKKVCFQSCYWYSLSSFFEITVCLSFRFRDIRQRWNPWRWQKQ